MAQSFLFSQSLASLTKDGIILFSTRALRLFSYGFVSVILVLYLIEIGLSNIQIGVLLTLTLLGDAVISLLLSLYADQVGKKNILMFGSVLIILAGIVFAITDNFVFLIIAATIGVISPSGYEIGPFLGIEQAGLSQTILDKLRTRIFAWYYLVGSFATALGSLACGVLVEFLIKAGWSNQQSYQLVILLYSFLGLILCILFSRLSNAIEIKKQDRNIHKNRLGIGKSKKIIFKLAGLFAIDSFGGCFILNSILAYWFYLKFHSSPAVLGSIFFGASVLSGLSALVAARIASRFGLINTMVFTHIPSNILLILIPFMPNLTWAVIVYFIRCTLSQMDVPTRQSYTMAVVDPSERSAAGGITNIARTLGGSCAPLFTSFLLSDIKLLNLSFLLAGAIKTIYDVLLYFTFRKIKPPEEIRS